MYGRIIYIYIYILENILQVYFFNDVLKSKTSFLLEILKKYHRKFSGHNIAKIVPGYVCMYQKSGPQHHGLTVIFDIFHLHANN